MTIAGKVVLLLLATLLCFFDFFLFFKRRKKAWKVTGLKQFVLEDLFFLGEDLYQKNPWKEKQEAQRKRRLRELYPPLQAEEINKSAAVAPATYLLLGLPLLLLLLFFSEDVLLFLLELLLLGFLCYSFDFWLKQTIAKRHEEMEASFASMLTKIALMVQAGITAAEAFRRVAYSADGLLYDEMQQAVNNMNNGMSMEDALDEFVLRCPLKEGKKFASLFRQNRRKGGPDFPNSLNEMAEQAWEERKNRAKVKGELADQKLLGPTLLMFIGILLMIMIPAFENLF